MIYIKNTTDTQVIFIDREVQSIENITPITLDSNYYTKVEVNELASNTLNQAKRYTDNLANEYYDIAEEYIDSNIERLENRIDELENNGGSSNVYVVNLNQLTQELIPEIITAFENGEVIIYRINTTQSKVMGKVIALGGQSLTSSSKSLKMVVAWYNDNRTADLNTSRHITFKEIIITADGVEQIDVDITDLKNRIEIIENNGGGSSTDEGIPFTQDYLDRIYANESMNFIQNNEINVLDERVTNLEENGGGTSDDGNDVVYFNFDIEDGEFNVNDDFNFKIVAQALKENKVVYVNGCLVTSYFIYDDLKGYISIVNNNVIVIYDAMFANFQQNTISVTSQWFVIPTEDEIDYINEELFSINRRVTDLENNGGGSSDGDTTELENRVTDIENRAFNNVDSLENQIKANTDRLDTLENNGGSSDDIEIMTILNYNLTQEQVNYICENYSTKNILFKGQYQDEDTFDWLELIRCKVYGKEDDGNWVATIGFSDGVYRYIFDAEKVFNENDELVWQVTKEVEDIYEQTIKDVLINDLATLDGKFREIEVLLDYNNVVNILNGMQSICVLTTRTDIIYSNIIKYIFAVGSDGNNLVKYVWKKQNDNVTFSSEIIGGGGGSTDGTSDVVKYDRGLENYDVFQSVAKDLVENKVVIVKKSDWDEYFGTIVSYTLNNDEGFYRGHIKYLINNNLNDIYCENENEINLGYEINLNLNDFRGEIKDELKSYSIELGENFEMQASQFIDYKDNRDKPFILKINVWDEDNGTTNYLTLNGNHEISAENQVYNEDGDYTEKWYDGYVTAEIGTQIYKWEFNIDNTLRIEYNDGSIEEQYNAVIPTIIDLSNNGGGSTNTKEILTFEIDDNTILTYPHENDGEWWYNAFFENNFEGSFVINLGSTYSIKSNHFSTLKYTHPYETSYTINIYPDTHSPYSSSLDRKITIKINSDYTIDYVLYNDTDIQDQIDTLLSKIQSLEEEINNLKNQ